MKTAKLSPRRPATQNRPAAEYRPSPPPPGCKAQRNEKRRQLSAEQERALRALRKAGRVIVAGAIRQTWHDGRVAGIPGNLLPSRETMLVEVGNQVAARSPVAWAGMTNRAMQRKLYAGQAVDLSGQKDEGGRGEAYRLSMFEKGVDYCNAETEKWIRSIGRCKETGETFAACDRRYHGDPAFDCLFLRRRP